MFSKLFGYFKSEPVRVHLYTLITAGLAFVVAKGYLPVADLPYVLGVVASILGVESLRGKVTPTPEPVEPPAPVPDPPLGFQPPSA